MFHNRFFNDPPAARATPHIPPNGTVPPADRRQDSGQGRGRDRERSGTDLHVHYAREERRGVNEEADFVDELYNKDEISISHVQDNISLLISAASPEKKSTRGRQLKDIFKSICERIGDDFATYTLLMNSLLGGADRLMYLDPLATLYYTYLCSPGAETKVRAAQIDSIRAFAKRAPPNSPEATALLNRCDELKELEPDNASRQIADREHEVYRYGKLQFHASLEMPTEKNFFLPSRSPTRRDAGVQADAAILEEDHVEHMKTLFYLLREDCTHEIRESICILRRIAAQTKFRDMRQFRGALKAENQKRTVRLLDGLRFSGVTFVRNYGFVCLLELPAYYNRRRELFLSGNLIAICEDVFDPQSPWTSGTLFVDSQKKQHDDRRNVPTRINFVPHHNPRKFLERCLNGCPPFVGVVSSAFYASYACALQCLKTFCEAPDENPIPLSRPLFCIEDNSEPLYVAGKELDISGIIVTRDGHSGTLNPTELANWELVCEEWSIEKEDALRERGDAEPHMRHCHVVESTQRAALHNIFSHRVAVVQGTPGTGKSFLAVKTIEMLHKNRETLSDNSDFGPILLMSLTNHAVDAVLLDVMKYLNDCYPDELEKENIGSRILGLGSCSKEESLAQRRFPPEVLWCERELFIRSKEFQSFQKNFFLPEKEFGLIGSLKSAQLNAVKEAVKPFSLCADVDPWRLCNLFNEANDLLHDDYFLDHDYDTVIKKLQEIFDHAFDMSYEECDRITQAVEQPLTFITDSDEKLMECWTVYSPNNPLHKWLWVANKENIPRDLGALLKKLGENMEQQQRQLKEEAARAQANPADDGNDAEVNEAVQDERNAALDNDFDEGFIFESNNEEGERTAITFFTRFKALPTRERDAMITSMSLNQRNAFLWALRLYKEHLVRAKVKEMLNEDLDDKVAKNNISVVERKAKHMRGMFIIAGTVHGMLTEIDAIRKVKPRVVIVEEAAQVMEGFTLAALTTGVEHLILIGDHKQLSPKATVHELQRKNIEVSLQERLVLSGSPYSTLTKQRRAHPVLSQLVHQYYSSDKNQPVQIEDHPCTEQIPSPLGVEGDRRFFLVDYDPKDHKNATEVLDEGSTSYYNEYEADVIRSLLTHLLRYNPDKEFIVLVAYRKQLGLLKPLIKGLSGNVRLRTIDDFQGEEGDFILMSTVRTGEPGFLKIENRACVALSRARMACYIVGHQPMLKGAASVYREALSIFEKNHCIGNYFPGTCPRHHVSIHFTTFSSYEKCNCKKRCEETLPCGHKCTQYCHSLEDRSHEKFSCSEVCGRIGAACKKNSRLCDHPCQARCCDDCPPCKVLLPFKCPECHRETDVPCHVLREAPDRIQCKNIVTVPEEITYCGHPIEVECWMSKNLDMVAKKCKKPCGETLPCGHICRLDCHAVSDPEAFAKAHIDEQKKCQRLRSCDLPCGHKGELKCNEDISTAKCPNRCDFKMPCGHSCSKRKCGHRGPHECNSEREKRCDRCGTVATVKCIDYERAVCKNLCRADLPCGHYCKAQCGTCPKENNGMPAWLVHQPCRECCDKELACGHRCMDGCGISPCGRCKANCTFECGYGRPCSEVRRLHPCSECPKMSCMEPCAWACPHHKCKRKCSELCDRPRCDKPCTKKLGCGHPCRGVCGEQCPPHCPICYSEGKQAKRPRLNDLGVVFGGDDATAEAFLRLTVVEKGDVSERLVLMPCCGTLTLAGVLDGYLDSKREENREAGSVNKLVPKCPFEREDGSPCKRPLLPIYYRRGFHVIVDGYQQLARFNKKLCEQDEEAAQRRAKCHSEWAAEVINLFCDIDNQELHQQYDDICGMLQKQRSHPSVKAGSTENALDLIQREYDEGLSEEIQQAKRKLFDAIFSVPRAKGCESCRVLMEVLFFDSPWLRHYFTERFFMETGESLRETQQQRDLIPHVLTLAYHIIDFVILRSVAVVNGSVFDPKYKTAENRFIREGVLRMKNTKYQREKALQSWIHLVQLQLIDFASNLYSNKKLQNDLCQARYSLRTDSCFFVPESLCAHPQYLTELLSTAPPLLARGEPLTKSLRSGRPSPQFLREIGAALNISVGQWFKCPNDHFYVIGDCGGAMELSQCPECKAVVGGTQHKTVTGNKFAGDYIEPGAQPSWPQ